MATFVAPPDNVVDRKTSPIINLDHVFAIDMFKSTGDSLYRIRFSSTTDQSKAGSAYYWKFEQKTDALNALNMLLRTPDSTMFFQLFKDE